MTMKIFLLSAFALLFQLGSTNNAFAVGNYEQPIDDSVDSGYVVRIVFEDEGTPVPLDESDDLIVQVASRSKSFGGCVVHGRATIYGGKGDGPHQILSGGGHLNPGALTAAYRGRRGSSATVTYKGNTVKVRINDFGPAAWTGNLIDLTPAAARAIGLPGAGPVEVKFCG
jgi:hypothetical protein